MYEKSEWQWKNFEFSKTMNFHYVIKQCDNYDNYNNCTIIIIDFKIFNSPCYFLALSEL